MSTPMGSPQIGPPPGWYPDPMGRPGTRWWDGQSWGMSDREWAAAAGVQLDGDEPDGGLAPDTPIVGSFLLALVVGLVAGGILATLAAVVADDEWAAVGGGIGLYSGFLLVARWRSRSHGTGDLRRDLGIAFQWRDLWTGFGQMWLARLLAVPIALIAMQFDDEPTSGGGGTGDDLGPQLEGFDLAGPNLIPLFLLIVVLAPIFEEIFFRGFIQPVLVRRWNVVAGIGVTSFLFSLVHVIPGATAVENLTLVATTFVLGCVFGRLVHRKGRIGPAIAAHAFFNGLTLLAAAIAF